jgi:hypothetical protein
LGVCSHGRDQRFVWSGQIDTAGLSAANLIVEGALSGEPFSISAWPNAYRALRPDVCILRPERRSVALIEVKTVGASVSGNILLYEEVANYLVTEGWTAEVFYLLSCGYEGSWRVVTEYNLRLILWESVIERAKDTPLGKSLGVDLNQFAVLPAELGGRA